MDRLKDLDLRTVAQDSPWLAGVGHLTVIFYVRALWQPTRWLRA